ncbi:hypothetical protein, partial [Vibrio campbellii]|uniref:hypothetical protein n=1 Tax=Vibrio campbellii TaxID=680 RepID=UPI001BDAAB5F
VGYCAKLHRNELDKVTIELTPLYCLVALFFYSNKIEAISGPNGFFLLLIFLFCLSLIESGPPFLTLNCANQGLAATTP